MRLILSIFFLFFTSIIGAQNLVINGDFEYYSSCPTDVSQVANCTGWRQYTAGTSDYFHVCGTMTNMPFSVRVPDNWFGYQQPASGKAYIGCYSFDNCCDPTPYTEYIAGSVGPLIAGYRYEVSMSVSLADSSGYCTNGLGVWFYKDGPATLNTPGMLQVTPQVSFSNYGIIDDSLDWVRLTAVFTADSAYENIVIGTFQPTPVFLSRRISHSVFRTYSYYYVDSVSVRMLPGINNMFAGGALCTGDTFNVQYTVNSWAAIHPGNTFSVQLSNPSGSFANDTIVVGSLQSTGPGVITCVIPTYISVSPDYRLRIVSDNRYYASDPSLDKLVIGMRPLNVTANVNSPVCKGGVIHLHGTSSAPPAVNYSWTGPNGYSSGNSDSYIPDANASEHNGRYIMTADALGCKTVASVDVNVLDPIVDLGPDEVLCMNETRLLKVENENSTYMWHDGRTSPEYMVNGPGTYWVTAYTPCGILTDTVTKGYEICECAPFVPTAFTPNGDGLNDKIGLTYIDCEITRFEFMIANRYGEVIFETTDTKSKWDGMYKGSRAEIGTYFYLLQVKGPRNKDFKFKGDITLIR